MLKLTHRLTNGSLGYCLEDFVRSDGVLSDDVGLGFAGKDVDDVGPAPDNKFSVLVMLLVNPKLEFLKSGNFGKVSH